MSNISLILAILLASIHIFASRWTSFLTIPRNAWLSFGGGISVTYVFLIILPELHKGHHTLLENNSLSFIKNLIFLLSLIGLVFFYGLETMARKSKSERTEESVQVFWLHIASYALYNMLLGYLLHHKDQESIQKAIFFFIAIAAHFMVNDFGLQETYKKLYGKEGRWILATSIILGWFIGQTTSVSEATLATFLAILSGGIILNILKEELPEERSSRFSAFFAGVVLYTFALTLTN